MNNSGITAAEDKRRQRALKVQALALEGLTQAEIGKRVGLSQRGVGVILSRLGGKPAKRARDVAQSQARAAVAAVALGVPVAPNAPVRHRAPGAGRKPAGDGGVRVRDYPAVMLRLPVATLASLKALAAVRGVPVWRLIDAAVVAYVATVRGAEAEDVRRLAKREAERLAAKHPE
jgi:predicted transcriptional regulator